MKEKIEQILSKHIDIIQSAVHDDSERHAAHKEAQISGGGHFNLFIVSNDFENKTSLERHRMIYELLKEHLQKDIHALSIKALTEKEHLGL